MEILLNHDLMNSLPSHRDRVKVLLQRLGIKERGYISFPLPSEYYKIGGIDTIC